MHIVPTCMLVLIRLHCLGRVIVCTCLFVCLCLFVCSSWDSSLTGKKGKLEFGILSTLSLPFKTVDLLNLLPPAIFLYRRKRWCWNTGYRYSKPVNKGPSKSINTKNDLLSRKVRSRWRFDCTLITGFLFILLFTLNMCNE